VTLFNKEGYNDDTTGQQLEVRGPVDIHCLDKIPLNGGKGNWLTSTRSYKMGGCAAEESVALATNAVKVAASTSLNDLHALSAKAISAATGEFGSVVVSYTRAHDDDGIAYPYDHHALTKAALEVMQTGAMDVVTTTEDDALSAASATTIAASEYAKAAAESDAFKKIEAFEDGSQTTPPPTSGDAFTPAGGWHSTSAHAALKMANAEYHEAKAAAGSNTSPLESESEKPEWHGNATAYFKDSHLKIEIPFPESHSPDDPEDMLKHDLKANSNKTGGGSHPCADKNSAELCADFKRKGSCTFDYAERDCKKTCQLCPPDQGSVWSDASLDTTTGHYSLGHGRRRIGAGFGRRRAPVATRIAKHIGMLKNSAKYKSGDYEIKHGESDVPKTVEYPDGKKKWVALVPKAKDEAKIANATEADATLPQPIDHPNAAAAQESAAVGAEEVSDVPPAVASPTTPVTPHEKLETMSTAGNKYAMAALASEAAQAAKKTLDETPGSASSMANINSAISAAVNNDATATAWAADQIEKEEATGSSTTASAGSASA